MPFKDSDFDIYTSDGYRHNAKPHKEKEYNFFKEIIYRCIRPVLVGFTVSLTGFVLVAWFLGVQAEKLDNREAKIDKQARDIDAKKKELDLLSSDLDKKREGINAALAALPNQKMAEFHKYGQIGTFYEQSIVAKGVVLNRFHDQDNHVICYVSVSQSNPESGTAINCVKE